MKKAPHAPARPERWRVDVGDGDVAALMIPPDSFRTRRFEIDCRLVVRPLGPGAQHAMRVDVDGDLEWSRRAPTENPGQTDSMDYHFRRELPPGKPLRIVVKTEARLVRRERLLIEAEEQD